MFDTKWTYMIMHKNELVASIRKDGYSEVYSSSFMPYNLYLETKTQDLDERVNNLTNFYCIENHLLSRWWEKPTAMDKKNLL